MSFSVKMFFVRFLLFCLSITPLHSLCGQTPDIFHFDKGRELRIIGIGAGLLATGTIMYLKASGPDPAELDRMNVWSIERFTIDMSDRNTAEYSDVAAGGCLLLPFLTALTSRSSRIIKEDMIMYFESALVTQGLIELTKSIVNRPRPYAYRAADGATLSRNASRSFISGHSAAAFQGAVFAATVFQKRNPDSPLIIPVWAAGLTLATATAVFRVTSGNHFPSDVLAGAVVGSLIGWLIPTLHTKDTLHTHLQTHAGILHFCCHF